MGLALPAVFMMFALKVENPFNKLSRIHKLYVDSFKAGGQGPMRRALERASAHYMRAMFVRFNLYSMGGGDWEPLAESTIKRKKHDAILSDTDTLRNALNPMRLRNSGLLTVGHKGFKIGLPSGLNHPKSGLDVASLADVHHYGKANSRNKRLPARRILVQPGMFVKYQMNKEIYRGLKELVDQAKR